ncbi:hypothetical protein V1264_020634 [Littorina saxatilis]|uniref:Fucolectin-related molecule n=1 Tax=Littorina saxatilis TaxID=31220 RepID=A0AAN9BD21_9CAEN
MELCGIAFAVVICLFVTVQGQSQTCSARCSQWCGNGGLIFPGSTGRIVNVAFGKAANVSSPFRDSQGTAAPACIAVNGRTSTTYRTINETNTNCIHTDLFDFDASWSVDLGRNYTVTNITIYRRKGAQRRMSGIHVEVDNQTCYTFPLADDNGTALDALPEKIDVTCTPPLTGREVRLQKRGQRSSSIFGPYMINVCEVQVWGCSTGSRGGDCRCGHCRGDADCDVTTLRCPSGCDKGWDTEFCNQSCPAGTHGYGCRERCGQCADSDTCNTVTGLCPNGCQPGWQGDNCKQRCADGYYGQRCMSRCGDCSDGEVCDKVNGTCPTGCQPGFNPFDRLCKTACPLMRYGAECAHRCGQCQNNACDVVTGHCDACQPKLLHPLCQVCAGKMYGAECDTPCSVQCGGDGSCHRNNGRCQAGCASGYLLGSGFCDEKTSESSPNLAGPVAGGVFGGLCVITLSILLVGL